VDEAARLRGLVRLLEWGDAPLVDFAQEAIAAFPDPDAAAAALRTAGESGMRTNIALVNNVLGCVRGPALGGRLEGFLLRCFDVPDPQVRRVAVMEYAQSAAKPDLAAIGRCAMDPWAPTAQSAFRALEVLHDPAAAAKLRAVFPKVGPFCRASACDALGRLGGAESIPLLRAALAEARAKGEPETSLLVGAAQGLARMGEEEGLAELRRYVLALPLDRPAAPTDYAPEDWDGPEALLARARDAAFKGRLLLQARKADPLAAAAAVRVLSTLYPPDGEIAAAVGAAYERPDAELNLTAEGLDALRARNAVDGIARATAALESPVEERRYGAVLAMGRWKDPAIVPVLAACVGKDGAMAVRRKACDALGLIGDPAAAPALLEFLAGETAPTPDRALQAMTARANLRGPLADAAAEGLAKLASGKGSEAIRFNAAWALGQARKSPVARPTLEALLRDPSAAIRTAAADALGKLGDRAARDAVAGAYALETDDGAASAEMEAILRLDLRNP
jgi:HEAT repeat protein